MLARIAMIALVLLLGTFAIAEEKPRPATQPAKAQSPDEKAIRDLLKGLAKALQDGDAKQIKAVISASNDTEKKMVDAMSAMAVEIAKLYKASVKAFGEDQAKELTGDVAGEMGRIDEAEIAIDGEIATVRYPKEPTTAEDEAAPPPVPMTLKKVEGAWRVPMSELSKDSTPEEIEQTLTDLAAQTKVVSEVTSEITDGKYKTANKAAEGWQAKMMQVLMPRKEEKKPEEPKKSS
jgi:hypothetical protein